MLLCTFTAAGAATVYRKKAAQKSTGSASRSAPDSGSKAAATKTGTAHSATASQTPAVSRANAGTTHSATAHSATVRRTGKKGTPAATWRNRQLAPTQERYKEIQDALAAKGYLKAEDANGGWNQNSVEALKKFQADQNIESGGKINSLSLIALGLGPKRDTASLKTASEAAQSDR